jgi:hypothetical protein
MVAFKYHSFYGGSMSDERRASLYGETTAKSAEDVKPLGFMDILNGVFSEPVDLFKRMAKKPQWGWAMVALIVLALALTIAWAYKVDAQEVVAMQMERAAPQLSGADLDRAVEMGSKFLGVGGVLSVLFMTPIIILIGGLVWWAVGLISGEDGQWRPTYVHGLVVASVPKLVTVPYYLLGALMAILKPVGTLRADQLSPSSLGFWLRPDNIKLSIMYGQIDLFLLATYALLFLAARHTLRAKLWGALLCVALSLAVSVVQVLIAK